MSKKIPLLLLLLLLIACSANEGATDEHAHHEHEESADVVEGELTVTEVQANLTLPSNTGSVWMVIANGTDEDDALTGAAIEGCGVIELHDMVMEEDVMVMRQVEGGEIPVPAGETVELKRGGLHVMCLDKTGEFAEGEMVDIVLQFANAGTVNVTGTVVVPTGMMMDQDDSPTEESADDHGDDDHHADDDDDHGHNDDDHAAVVLGDAATQLKVAAVTAMMDDAGFHALDDQLNEEGDAITLENAAMVQHVRNALDRAEWPQELQGQVDELVGVLDELIPALLAEDMAAAAPLAAEAHDLQHALSNTVGSSLEEANHAPDPESVMFGVAVAQMVIDSADFHGMDERLNDEDGDIMLLDTLLVRRVQAAVADTTWPTELSDRAGEFETVLVEFVTALEAGDAAESAADTHTIQHDFSAEITEHLGLEDDHHE